MRAAAIALALALGVAGCGGGTGDDADADAVAAVNSGAVCAPADLPLTAKDGVRVFATYYAANHPKALILAFHQAGSSKDEYATIAPQLVKAGYSVLAVDQRSGGRVYGENETARALGSAKAAALSQDAGYITAVPDLQAALDWAGRQDAPVILWGSSYSSALIFKLAAENPGKATALLAFSPGEYFADPSLIRRAAARTTRCSSPPRAPSRRSPRRNRSSMQFRPSGARYSCRNMACTGRRC